MKKKKKTIGIFIIGIGITLLIAGPFLFLSHNLDLMMTSFDDPLGPEEYVVVKEDFSFHIGNLKLWGQDIFVYLLFIGIATTSLIALWNHKLSKGIVYPISIGLITGILLGIIFPAKGVIFIIFNRQILFAVLVLSFSISLISIGRYFLKK